MTDPDLRDYHELVRQALAALDEAKLASDRGDSATYHALQAKFNEYSERARAFWKMKQPALPEPASDRSPR